MTITARLTERITVELIDATPALEKFWHKMMAGWPPSTLASAPSRGQTIRLALTQVDEPPSPPTSFAPIFQDNVGLLHVYQATAEQLWLHFPDGALVHVDLVAQMVRGSFTAVMMRNARLEDVIFTSLAPLLRRHGYYLVHAFAAVCPATYPPGAALIVGPSRSGKTTTGLQLVLAGWKLLANDVVLLRQTPEGEVWASPWPGLITVRPRTFRLLPTLADHVGRPGVLPTNDVALTSDQIARKDWGTAVPIKAIYFPQIETSPTSQLIPKNRGIALARLLEESLDRWDTSQIAPHSALLRRLVQQAGAYQLRLGQDVAQLPDLLTLSAPVVLP